MRIESPDPSGSAVGVSMGRRLICLGIPASLFILACGRQEVTRPQKPKAVETDRHPSVSGFVEVEYPLGRMHPEYGTYRMNLAAGTILIDNPTKYEVYPVDDSKAIFITRNYFPDIPNIVIFRGRLIETPDLTTLAENPLTMPGILMQKQALDDWAVRVGGDLTFEHRFSFTWEKWRFTKAQWDNQTYKR